jgi:release factor glutamine methyltransferase
VQRRVAPTHLPAMQLRQVLRSATATLQNQNTPSAGLAAELLLMHVLGRDRAYLYTFPETELAPGVIERYFDLVAERATGKPTQYITGHQEFWGLDFEVSPDVLIPRPETEHLVEAVLELVSARDRAGARVRIVDVGTGSGCVALALASELPEALIYGSDVSLPALETAARNARKLGLEHRLRLVQADLLSCFAGGALDFVVSNPPYVGAGELHYVQREVREFEPRIAWGGSGRGDEIYAQLFAGAQESLAPGGHVAVEVGYNQAKAVAGKFGKDWDRVAVRPDLAGIPRVVTARKSL